MESDSKEHPAHHHSASSELLKAINSPRRLAIALVSALLVWTALLGVVASLGGITVTSSTEPPVQQNYHMPLTPTGRRRLLRSPEASDAPEDRDIARLLDELRGGSEPSVSATLTDLRSALASREAKPGAAPQLAAPPAGGGGGAIAVPRYNPNSITELQKAALTAAMPEQVRGPLPQLVRDMSAAMAKQQKEHEELQRRLSLLQPSVLNYNPKDVEQLAKAAKEVTSSPTGGEVSGALPRLLKDLNEALHTQQEEQKKLEKKLAAVAGRKARSTKRAMSLKELVMRTSSRIEDKVTILFGEASDRCSQAVDEAKEGAEADAGDGDENDNHKWQDTMQQLQEAVMEEFRAAAERNATLTARLLEEQAARKLLEERLTALTTPPPPPPPPSGDDSTSAAAAAAAAATAAVATTPVTSQAGIGAATEEGSVIGGAAIAPASSLPGVAPSDPTATATPDAAAAAAAASAGGIASAASPLAFAAETPADFAALASPPPPSPPPLVTQLATGACVGKRCPAGYDMIDRGDQCTCRPQPAAVTAV